MTQVDQYRRHLIKGIALGSLSPYAFAQNLSNKNVSDAKRPQKENRIFLSAQGSTSNEYSLSWFNSGSISQAKSSFRGHGISVHPKKDHTAILFARRPGTMGIEVNLTSSKVNQTFHCENNFHLTGHGCFTHDGQHLITSESNYKTGQGHIVVRDTDNYKIQAVHPSFGIGPHEIKLLNGQNTLVIANGGILTHPNSGREKLNLDTMRPNLTYFDLDRSKRIETVEYDEPKASIRHIDISQDNTVAAGLQMQRPEGYHNKTIALCATHQIGQSRIQPLHTDERIYNRLNDYIGSVCVSQKHHIAGFTSPRGNLALFFDLTNKNLLNAFVLQDVCGIALDNSQNHFVLSNANGHIRYISTADLTENTALRQAFTGSKFDNHLIAI